MALIVCRECGKDYSSFASACPQCACPTSEQINSGKELANPAQKPEIPSHTESIKIDQPPEYLTRRAKSEPWIVGAVTALISPILGSLVWGIRHRSWLEAIVPLLISGLIYAYSVDNMQDGFEKKKAKYGFQVLAGISMVIICHRNKKKALEKLNEGNFHETVN